jgi:eukaryotic-like serine/threonine-protein kinase
VPLTVYDLPTLSRLLDEAWEMTPDQRQQWLQTLPPEHAHLKSRLHKMLATQAGMETGVFVKPANDAAANMLHERSAPAWQIGSDVGGYRLLHEIGAGGMGAVWLAERSDGVLKRQVALKLPIFSIHNKALAERFDRERDILAGLAHPHIARLYDAGTVASGQPFLALEYVDGKYITDHCDAKLLSVDQRVSLFLQVLDAVQYAHSSLVLHRDLKHTNVLVTPEGEVKLLDFGIAKLIDRTNSSVEETELTQMGGQALTPDYASPEQISGGALTTASDVYSLGVLLYELLAGERPYKLKGQGRAALEDAILHASAVKPSQMVRTTESAEANAAKRSASPKKLAQQLAGDLDTILIKALKKNPKARYETAAAFAADLRRYLAGEAVEAQPDSSWYRLRKFVRRNKLMVGAGATVILALTVGAGVATWQAQQARQQAAKAVAVQTFLLDIFKASSDRQKDPEKARNTTARELLDVGADRIATALKNTPEGQLEVLDTLFDVYEGFALPDRMLDLKRKSLRVAKAHYGLQSREVARVLVDMSKPLAMKGLHAEHEAALRDAESILDRLGDETSRDRGRLLTAFALFYTSRDRTKSLAYAERAVDALRAFPSGNDLGLALFRRGRGLLLQSRITESVAPFEEAVQLGELHNAGADLSFYRENLGRAYADSLRFNDSETLLRATLQQSLASNGESSAYTLSVRGTLGYVLAESSQLKEAISQHNAAIEALKKTPDWVGFKGFAEYLYLGRALSAFGELNEAEAALKSAKELRDKQLPGTLQSARILGMLAVCLAEMGREVEVDAALAEASAILAKAGKHVGADEDVQHRTFMARAYLALGRTQQSVELLNDLKRIHPSFANAPHRAVLFQSYLAEAQFAVGNDVETLKALNSARSLLSSKNAEMAIPLLAAKLNLVEGTVNLRAGDAANAVPLLEKALAEREARLSPKSPFLAEAYLWVARGKFALGNRAEAASNLQKANDVRARNAQLGEHFERQFREVKLLLDGPAKP